MKIEVTRGLLWAVLLFTSLASAHAQSNGTIVFQIMLENHNWIGTGGVHGSDKAPYINHTLLPMAAAANNYFNPYGVHPSLPNYLWIEGGQRFGIYDDSLPSAHRLSTQAHFTRLLRNAGISWRAYAESISGQVCPLTPTGAWNANGNQLYQPKHVGQLYFLDNTDGGSLHSAYCIAHVRPYGQLASDLRNGTVARYNVIVPNMCDDGHDPCGGDATARMDTWLGYNLPLILNSAQYKAGRVVIFIVTDEAANGDGPIPFLVLGQGVKRGYGNEIRYTHSSLLRTLEEIYHVSPNLAYAAQAMDLRDLFWTLP
jgi:phosphatidylinositol-3-phosphatase